MGNGGATRVNDRSRRSWVRQSSASHGDEVPDHKLGSVEASFLH